jgi:hypothetical protein
MRFVGEPCQDTKDGLLVSGKYESNIKVTKGNPHVFVFANTGPEMLRMTSDRWNIIKDLSDDMTLHDLFPPSKYPDIVNFPDPFARDQAERRAESHGLAAPTYGYAGPMWRPPLMLDNNGIVHEHPDAGLSPTPPGTPPYGPTPGNTPRSVPGTPPAVSSSSKREKPSPHSTSPLTGPPARRARGGAPGLGNPDVDVHMFIGDDGDDEFMGMPAFPADMCDTPSDATWASKGVHCFSF